MKNYFNPKLFDAPFIYIKIDRTYAS